MKYLKHYYRITVKILLSNYSYNKFYLFFRYLTLIIKSIIYHKLQPKKLEAYIKSEKIFELQIHFFAYHQLINLFEEIFIYQVYNFKSANKSPIIVDCGSNIGLSVLFFKKLYPSSHIIAFEPEKETFKLLERNVGINNLSNVSLFNLALFDSEGKIILHKENSRPGSVTMSLIESADKPLNETVFSKKLSDYIVTPIDMIKIDVEGAEIAVIRDLIHCKKIEFVKNMIIEYHPAITKVSIDEFLALLHSANFSCHFVHDKLHLGGTEKMIYCAHNLPNVTNAS